MANALLARTNRDAVRSVDVTPLANPLLNLCNEAFKQHAAGEFAQAVALYERVLSLRPDQADIHNNLGHALAALGRSIPATIAFAHAVALKPEWSKERR